MSSRIFAPNLYFPPDASATSIITFQLCRLLAKRGHSVKVLCGRPSYDSPEKMPWRPLTRRSETGYAVERVGSTAFDRRRFTGRLGNYASYLLLAGLRAALSRRPDVVVVQTDPPLAIWVGLIAARGRPVVYVIRDLHPEAAVAAGWARDGRAVRAWERLHAAGLLRAEAIVCLGEDMAERVRAKGVPPERVAVVHDGASPPQGPVEPRVVDELRAGAGFVAMQAGNIGSAGAWTTLATAARMVGESVRLVFVGDGARAAELRGQGLTVVPFRPQAELPSVMAAGDVQIVSLRSGLEGLIVPSKLYTALAHGRPILAVVPGGSEVARIVEHWGCGLIANPDDPEDVAGALAWMRERPEATAAMAYRAAAAGRHFDRGASLERLVSLVETVAENRSVHRDLALADLGPAEVATPSSVPDAPLLPDYLPGR